MVAAGAAVVGSFVGSNVGTVGRGTTVCSGGSGVGTGTSIGGSGVGTGASVGHVVGVMVAVSVGLSVGVTIASGVGVKVGVTVNGVDGIGCLTTSTGTTSNSVCQITSGTPAAENVDCTKQVPACVAVTITDIDRASPEARSLASYGPELIETQVPLTALFNPIPVAIPSPSLPYTTITSCSSPTVNITLVGLICSFTT